MGSGNRAQDRFWCSKSEKRHGCIELKEGTRHLEQKVCYAGLSNSSQIIDSLHLKPGAQDLLKREGLDLPRVVIPHQRG